MAESTVKGIPSNRPKDGPCAVQGCKQYGDVLAVNPEADSICTLDLNNLLLAIRINLL